MKLCIGFVVVLLMLVLLFVGVPTQSARQVSDLDTGYSAVAEAPFPPAQVQRFVARFEPELADLNRARAELLFQAAQEALDAEALQRAAAAYREAMMRIRTRAADLEYELGPDDSRTMMYYASSVSRRIFALEMYAELARGEREQRD